MADGDPFLTQRFPAYVAPVRDIQKILDGAVEAFDKGTSPEESRHLLINYFNTHPRSVFVKGKGWYDLMHIAAAYAMSEKMGPRIALELGLDVEIAEALGVFGDKNRYSAFQMEDFRSNRIGAKMQSMGLDFPHALLDDGIKGKILSIDEAQLLGRAELMKNEGNFGFDVFLDVTSKINAAVQQNVGIAVEVSPLGAAAKSLQNAAKGAKALIDLIKKTFPKTPPKSVCVPCQGGDPTTETSVSGTVVGSGGDAGLTTFS
jgi:hypothetical protein